MSGQLSGWLSKWISPIPPLTTPSVEQLNW